MVLITFPVSACTENSLTVGLGDYCPNTVRVSATASWRHIFAVCTHGGHKGKSAFTSTRKTPSGAETEHTIRLHFWLHAFNFTLKIRSSILFKFVFSCKANRKAISQLQCHLLVQPLSHDLLVAALLSCALGCLHGSWTSMLCYFCNIENNKCLVLAPLEKYSLCR